MILERSMHPDWRTNTYLVAAGEDGPAALIDSGGPLEPLLAALDVHRLELTHVLLTHHHYDHVAELERAIRRAPAARILIHPSERAEVPLATGVIESGELFGAAGLDIEALHTPGHTGGMLAFVVNGVDVFTGDTLFRNSVGGVRAPGSTGYEDLKASVMDVLMKLDPDTRVHPGHSDPTTIGEEWESNSFIRIWRGLDPEGDEPCTVWDNPATLVHWGDDYDGGHKAWVRWRAPNPEGLAGRDDIVPGSQVVRGSAG